MPKNKEYPGYPEYVVITLPKQGTKTMNKCFTSLGYRVFDIMQINDFAKEFHDYGTEKINFAELAKIWEDNKFEVIIEPSALFWQEMVDHWPKTKFIQLTRDMAGFKKSLEGFLGTLADIPKGAIMDHHHYASPMISPTAHHALTTVVRAYSHYACHAELFLDKNISSQNNWLWPKMLERHWRMFHSDVTCHAPKDRTLFNYNAIKDGWGPLRDFLGLPANNNDSFPHENKGAQAQEFYEDLFTGGTYGDKVEEETKAYFARNGYDVKKLPPQ